MRKGLACCILVQFADFELVCIEVMFGCGKNADVRLFDFGAEVSEADGFLRHIDTVEVDEIESGAGMGNRKWLLDTSLCPRDRIRLRMPSSAWKKKKKSYAVLCLKQNI